MSLNPNTRYITAEVLLSEREKGAALAVCRELGIGISTWYRSLGNAAVKAHGSPPAPPKESRKCPGVGRPASRSIGATFGGAMRPSRV